MYLVQQSKHSPGLLVKFRDFILDFLHFEPHEALLKPRCEIDCDLLL